jgi:hypothetical protein
MQIIQPSQVLEQHVQNVSVAQALNGNLSPGNGTDFDTSGQPLTYSSDNMSGVILRIGSTANPHGLTNSWVGSNADTTIVHNLNKVPYGYIVIAKDKPCDVYWGSVAATDIDITLKCTDGSTDTTIWFLC